MSSVDWPAVVFAFLGIFALLLVALPLFPHRSKRPRSDSEQQ